MTVTAAGGASIAFDQVSAGHRLIFMQGWPPEA
jgi:hypothetical protein